MKYWEEDDMTSEHRRHKGILFKNRCYYKIYKLSKVHGWHMMLPIVCDDRLEWRDSLSALHQHTGIRRLQFSPPTIGGILDSTLEFRSLWASLPIVIDKDSISEDKDFVIKPRDDDAIVYFKLKYCYE
jgi:hypothetical protein